MSSETLEVKKRDELGTLATNRLRQTGYVPANLYGHGEPNVNLAVRADTIHTIIHHGGKLLSLTGDVTRTRLCYAKCNGMLLGSMSCTST